MVPGFGRHVLLCRGRMPQAGGMDMEHFANKSLSVVAAKYCFLGFVV